MIKFLVNSFLKNLITKTSFQSWFQLVQTEYSFNFFSGGYSHTIKDEQSGGTIDWPFMLCIYS